jgi:hypothetical protein
MLSYNLAEHIGRPKTTWIGRRISKTILSNFHVYIKELELHEGCQWSIYNWLKLSDEFHGSDFQCQDLAGCDVASLIPSTAITHCDSLQLPNKLHHQTTSSPNQFITLSVSCTIQIRNNLSSHKNARISARRAKLAPQQSPNNSAHIPRLPHM